MSHSETERLAWPVPDEEAAAAKSTLAHLSHGGDGRGHTPLEPSDGLQATAHVLTVRSH